MRKQTRAWDQGLFSKIVKRSRDPQEKKKSKKNNWGHGRIKCEENENQKPAMRLLHPPSWKKNTNKLIINKMLNKLSYELSYLSKKMGNHHNLQ